MFTALKLGPYIAILLVIGYVLMLRSGNATLRSEAVVANIQLETCIARKVNVNEDEASDAEIDNLDDLSGAAAEFLRN